jgi:hypothetical protein
LPTVAIGASPQLMGRVGHTLLSTF